LPNSRAKVYRDHTVLESGSELMRNGEKQTIEAATLQIASAAKDGVVLVAMGGPNNVRVFASSGVVQVRTAAGLLVASLRPGMGLAFTPQAGAATAMQVTGVLESTDGKFFLTDSCTKTGTRVEVRGTDLAKFKGKTVQITGSIMLGVAAAGGASQLVQVTKIEQLSDRAAKACAPGAVGATGAAGGGAGAATGTIFGVGVATAVVIGAAAVAGITIGALAIADAGPFASNP
jgi:polyferredoxin